MNHGSSVAKLRLYGDGSESAGEEAGDERWQWGHKCKVLPGMFKKTCREEEETQRVGWIKVLK